MTKKLTNGIIVITIIIAITILIKTSPDWYAALNKVHLESAEKRAQIELIKTQHDILLRREQDSLELVRQKSEESLVQKELDSLKDTYNDSYNFLIKALGLNGNIETEHFLALRRFNKKDSTQLIILYGKINAEQCVSTLNNGTRFFTLSTYRKKVDWFNIGKRVIPHNPFQFNQFDENKGVTLPKLINIMDEFKREYLIN